MNLEAMKAWVLAKLNSARMKERGWTAYEIGVSVLPFAIGAEILFDALTKKWGWAIFYGIIVVVMVWVNASLHRVRRQLIALLREQRGFLLAERGRMLKERDKLRAVAMSAVALGINIEHGFPPNLEALKRDLAALTGEPVEFSKPN